MSAPDVLFKGIPRGPTRGYTAKVLQAFRPETVVIPCCGSFSLAAVAKIAGVLPQDIVCGDISLYSTALGHAVMGQDWRLEIEPDCPFPRLAEILTAALAESDGPVSKAAVALLGVRFLQYVKRKSNRFYDGLRDELCRNAASYLEQLRLQAQGLAEEIGGCQFIARDMWETLPEYMGDERVVMLVNPPRYDGGYERQFMGVNSVFSWDEPTYDPFKEKDYARLMKMLGSQPALTLMYYATPGEDPSPLWDKPWRSVFADKPGQSRALSINWIVANRTVIPHEISRSALPDLEAQYPMIEDEEITADSVLWAERVAKDVGDYYHDLLIHKLPGGHTELYSVLLLDGLFLAVVGLHLHNWRRGSGKHEDGSVESPASLTFAFSVPHKAYKRLHKLVLMAILSSWFWEDLLAREQGYSLRGIPRVIQSTMLTMHPENKTARGTGLKLAAREQQKDGAYKLTYYGPVIQRSREETLALWLSKFGASTK
jgi:hypothetical protein